MEQEFISILTGDKISKEQCIEDKIQIIEDFGYLTLHNTSKTKKITHRAECSARIRAILSKCETQAQIDKLCRELAIGNGSQRILNKWFDDHEKETK